MMLPDAGCKIQDVNAQYVNNNSYSEKYNRKITHRGLCPRPRKPGKGLFHERAIIAIGFQRFIGDFIPY